LARWAILWPCIHEFLAIATHPRVFDPPSPLADALAAVESWRSFATLPLLQEVDGWFYDIFSYMAVNHEN
jgi:hypothetical protein